MLSLLTILITLTTVTLADDLKQNGEECSCFRTNSSSSSYFSYHRFHDFRNVQTNSTGAPKIIKNYTDDANFVSTSNFFSNPSGWIADWETQTWNNSDQLTPENAATGGPTVLMLNSANNVYIDQSSDSNPAYTTYLTLRTARLQGFQSAAEIDSTRSDFLHLSARFLARITGSPGATAGIFTYLNNNNPQKVQEIDIEILTDGPKSDVQYTNQPSDNSQGNEIAGTTMNSTIPKDLDWTQWNIYRLDWLEGASTWYVNGAEVATIRKNVPQDPSQLILNIWGNGGSWTGNMSVGGEAILQVQWIEVAFNTSGNPSKRNLGPSDEEEEFEVGERDSHNADGHLLGKRGHKGCEVVCSIDNVTDIGTPILLFNNTSPAPKTFISPICIGNLFSWISILVAGTLVAISL